MAMMKFGGNKAAWYPFMTGRMAFSLHAQTFHPPEVTTPVIGVVLLLHGWLEMIDSKSVRR
jgi:hypothetical protein